MVHVAIAITALNSHNGWFRWEGQEEDLQIGDGLAWRGDCRRAWTSGEGGVILLVTYQVVSE